MINRCIFLLAGLLIFSNSWSTDWVDSVGFQPTLSANSNWMFFGTVSNDDSGDNFNYIFHMQRNASTYTVHAALIDAQTHEIIAVENTQAEINEPEEYNWRVGKAFLSFNPINASWIFGVTDKDKVGFNFKIDLLRPSQKIPVVQSITPGLDLVIIETGLINGHIQRGDKIKDQFVTAKTAWFRQIWLNKPDQISHHLNGMLCQFTDYSGWYYMNTLDSDAVRGSIAGAFDENFKSAKISQFISVKKTPEGDLQINIPSPQSSWLMKPILDQNQLIAGFIKNKNLQGFCGYTQDVIGH